MRLRRFYATFTVRPRFWMSALFGLAVLAGLWRFAPGAGSTKSLLAWDCSAVLYLTLSYAMMARADIDAIRRRARQEDEGRLATLWLSVLIAIASLFGVVAEMHVVKTSTPDDKLAHVALALVAIVLSWAFMHTMFALHYAHEFYSGDDTDDDEPGCLEFPGGEKQPDYWDFVYFSFIIGTSAQTADVGVSGRAMRRLVLVQSTLAFFFNTMVLALTINIAASQIG